jgi:MltA-interacting protein MipA
MRRMKTLPLAVVALSLLCLSAESTISQTRRRPQPANTPSAPKQVQKRRVILALKGQEGMAADFIQADAETVTVEINGARSQFKMDEVGSIIFSPEEAAKMIAEQAQGQASNAAAGEALRALRKVAGAVEVGVNYQQYGQLVIEAKAAVDEALATIPAGELRNEIAATMDSYADAGRVWTMRIKPRGDYGVSDLLKTKYGVSEREAFRAYSGDEIYVTGALHLIWNQARQHLDRATALPNQ